MAATDNVELTALSALTTEVCKFHFLNPNFPMMSKIPLWDGDIYVYNPTDPSNKNLLGRIPVQIKGRTVKKWSEEYSSFSIKQTDLLHYSNDGGILFFVIEILESTRQTKIFCEPLLPYDIANITKKIKKQQEEISIHIHPLSQTHTSSLYYICLNFLDNRKRQRSVEIIQLEEIEGLKRFEIHTVSDTQHPFRYLLENETYVYAVVPNNIQIPVLKGIVNNIATELKKTVSIGGVEYYQQCSIQHIKEGSFLCIGESLKFFFGTTEGKVNFTPQGSLDTQLLDTSFLIATIKNRGFYIGSFFLALSIKEFDEKEASMLSQLEKRRCWLAEIKKLLIFLGIDFMDNFSLLPKKDVMVLERLAQFIVRQDYKKPVFKKRGFHCIHIAARPVLLFSYFVDGIEKIENVFSLEFASNIKLSGRHYPESGDFFSPYCLLKHDAIVGAANFRKSIVIESVKAYEFTDTAAGHYINLLLEIIKACDEAPEREDIKELGVELAQYLLDHEDNVINRLNWLQLQKRLKDHFSSEELDVLQNMLEKELSNSTINHENICGIMILLKDKTGFMNHFCLLDSKKQEVFKSYPIYTLLDT